MEMIRRLSKIGFTFDLTPEKNDICMSIVVVNGVDAGEVPQISKIMISMVLFSYHNFPRTWDTTLMYETASR
jgi:hypothetical protein